MTRTGLILDKRYRLDQRIAAGGVGQVWRATDLLLERPVAVKVLRPEYADHPETLDRFSKEARHAGALSHPHVAAVYDYGPGGPEWPPYLVMEFVDGPSLADVLAVEPAEPVFALDVIAQAADGLSAAHRAGLVHRDVKPGNILISSEGLVKVTDFGIAHAAGQAPVTGPDTVMGTTQYMAPERISGDQGSPASDLYALGIVLHECLTGEPPYEGAPADVMAAHLYSPLPPLPEGLPPALGTLIARLTVKDPADRISDARELAVAAADLRDAIDPGSSGIIPGPAGARRPPGKRRRGATLAVSAVVIAGTAVVALLIAGALRQAPAAKPAAPAPARSAGPSAPGSHPRRVTRSSAPAAGTGGTAVSGTASPQALKGHQKPSPAPSAGAGTSPAASISPAPRQGPSVTPGSSAPSGSPSSDPPTPTPPTTSGPPEESPSPDPTPSATPTTSTCVLGVVCL